MSSALARRGLLVAALGTLASSSAAQDGAQLEDVAKLFQARCVSCHIAPDPAIDTDRAWLRQVEETA